MLETKFQPLNVHMTGELARHGNWVVASIGDPVFWPTKVQSFQYRGATIFILPVSTDHYPAVALRLEAGMDRLAGQRLILRFLSALAWVEGQAAVVEYWSGGNLPRPMGRSEQHRQLNHGFDLSYLPEPDDERACLALALFREGRALNHPAYAFLSHFRVLDIHFKTSKAMIDWINVNLDAVETHTTKNILTKLKAEQPNVGEYLYGSGRCAVAHAKSEPLVDPDDPSDAERLAFELPLIAALAERLIETELGVETRHTVFRRHLYELAGFKDLLGPELVGLLAKGEKIEVGRMINIPEMRVALMDHEPYSPLNRLRAMHLGQEGHLLQMVLQNDDQRVMFRLYLDFKEGRLVFDVFHDLQMADDGTAAAARAIMDIRRFVFDYFCNGSLRIFDADNGKLLSRKDAFIPLNMMVNGDGHRADMAACQAEIDRRVAAEAAGKDA